MDTDHHLVHNGTILVASSFVLFAMSCKLVQDLVIHSRVKNTPIINAINIFATLTLLGATLSDACFGAAELIYDKHKDYEIINDIGYWTFYVFYTIEYTCLSLFFIFRLKLLIKQLILFHNLQFVEQHSATTNF